LRELIRGNESLAVEVTTSFREDLYVKEREGMRPGIPEESQSRSLISHGVVTVRVRVGTVFHT